VKITRERALGLLEFEALAAGFGRSLRPGDAVALSGELGAGKTTFVRAVVRELLGRDAATSPTFVFRHRYDGPPTIEHVDCYRIAGPADAAELGLEESLGPDRITLIEWPERYPQLVPAGAIRIGIEGSGDAPRELRIERP